MKAQNYARLRQARSIGQVVREAIEHVAGGDSALDAAHMLSDPNELGWVEGTAPLIPNRVNQRTETPADQVPGAGTRYVQDTAGQSGTSRKENDISEV